MQVGVNGRGESSERTTDFLACRPGAQAQPLVGLVERVAGGRRRGRVPRPASTVQELARVQRACGGRPGRRMKAQVRVPQREEGVQAQAGLSPQPTADLLSRGIPLVHEQLPSHLGPLSMELKNEPLVLFGGEVPLPEQHLAEGRDGQRCSNIAHQSVTQHDPVPASPVGRIVPDELQLATSLRPVQPTEHVAERRGPQATGKDHGKRIPGAPSEGQVRPVPAGPGPRIGRDLRPGTQTKVVGSPGLP